MVQAHFLESLYGRPSASMMLRNLRTGRLPAVLNARRTPGGHDEACDRIGNTMTRRLIGQKENPG